jgi:hypothetical protein
MASHVHCRVISPGGTQPQEELFLYIADEHPNIQSALSQSQPSQRLSHAIPDSALSAPLSRRRSSVPNQLVRLLRRGSSVPNQLEDALSTTMSGLATITNAPASMVTRHGFSCIQPSATSLSSVFFVQEPALQLLPLNTRHLYSSQAGLPRRSSWPAHVFLSSSKCLVINCSVFCFHRESHFWHQFVTSLQGSISRWNFITLTVQYTTLLDI